ncbi:MAG: nucleotidyl transferase AbiEii/AbiGii toxin family protein [Candidatus Binatia bacterium]
MPSGELLTPFQRKVLRAFTELEESKAFYLTGGTALSAFYLAHRLSEDFDLFTSEEHLISVVARKFKSALVNLAIHVEEIRSFSSFWEAVAREGAESFKIARLRQSLYAFSAR